MHKGQDLGSNEQQIASLQVQVVALTECVANYEEAIKCQQRSALVTEKHLKKANQRLDRLINLVTEHTDNAVTILQQLDNAR